MKQVLVSLVTKITLAKSGRSTAGGNRTAAPVSAIDSEFLRLISGGNPTARAAVNSDDGPKSGW